jgi:hypothetical protein
VHGLARTKVLGAADIVGDALFSRSTELET